MKRVLGIVGSPRRYGNTHMLVEEVLRGATRVGTVTETRLLGDLDIRECDGCHSCWEGIECPKKDDMLTLYPKIIESDFLVLGTPVYWYGPTALMKLFIDRLVYFNCPGNRQAIRGKRAVVVAPFEDTEEKTASLLVRFFEMSFRYLEMTLVDVLLFPGVTVRGEVQEKKQYMHKAFELGKNISSIF